MNRKREKEKQIDTTRSIEQKVRSLDMMLSLTVCASCVCRCLVMRTSV